MSPMSQSRSPCVACVDAEQFVVGNMVRQDEIPKARTTTTAGRRLSFRRPNISDVVPPLCDEGGNRGTLIPRSAHVTGVKFVAENRVRRGGILKAGTTMMVGRGSRFRGPNIGDVVPPLCAEDIAVGDIRGGILKWRRKTIRHRDGSC